MVGIFLLYLFMATTKKNNIHVGKTTFGKRRTGKAQKRVNKHLKTKRRK